MLRLHNTSHDELVWKTGDVFLIGSDGLGSIVGDDEELFEDRAMREVLAELVGMEGGQVLEKLVERATTFANGRPQPDDVNLVAITRNER